jgi:hypothetical protein
MKSYWDLLVEKKQPIQTYTFASVKFAEEFVKTAVAKGSTIEDAINDLKSLEENYKRANAK